MERSLEQPGAEAREARPAVLPPSGVLAVLRAVLADQAFTPAETRAVAAVICQANWSTGCSWCSYRQLQRDYHLGASQIRSGLAKALGRYLVEALRGAHGAVLYRVIAPASAPTAGASTIRAIIALRK